MAAKDELGRRGEQIAADHVASSGMRIVERNWRCQLGEIDIVALDDGALVFIEVKTRSSDGFGHPLEAITPRKLGRLRKLATAWCEAHPVPPGSARHQRPIRVDAIAVLVPPGCPARIDHLRGIF